MRRWLYAAAAVLLLGVAGGMIYNALSTSLVYFILPNEYARDPGAFDERRIRLGGIVEAGSVAFDPEGLQLTFHVTDSIESYAVRYRGAPPELFQENSGVVIEGRFDDGVFVGDNLLVKHSEVYQAPEPGQKIDIEALKDTLQ